MLPVRTIGTANWDCDERRPTPSLSVTGHRLTGAHRHHEDPLAKRNHPHFLVHSPKDNVGVVVIEDLKAGTNMDGTITETDADTSVTANSDIPIGHKIALVDLKAGATIIKYGEDVGVLLKDVKRGDHVHVHNHKTKRW
jgi:(2R)-sulfolactate sulfo-lyase subunit alpha